MSIYKILYGANDVYLDVTIKVLQQLSGFNDKGSFVATIPATDRQRCLLFTDPVFGVLKKIYIYRDNKIWKIVDHTETFEIPIYTSVPNSLIKATNILSSIHNSIDFKYGDLMKELPEQLMLCKFLPKTAKVLEIGTNIGRSSLVISSILEDDSQFVTLESCDESANQARENRDANERKFHIVNAALSLYPLYQVEWVCFTEPRENSVAVKTCTLNDIRQFNIEFDTLVLDCEGAFYNIIHEFPSILDNIKLIIVENDYDSKEKKLKVDEILDKKKFHCVYSEMLPSDDYPHECRDCFFEVWQRFV